MGCDIHIYREKQVDGKWVTADSWAKSEWAEEGDGLEVAYDERAYTGRNYTLFGTLSQGVREDVEFAFKPRGIPFDASPEVAASNDSWGADGHSHSYLFLHELKSLAELLKSKAITVTGMKDPEELKAFRKSLASGSPDYNLLFPYCRWASGGRYEEFSAEVPASFYIGESLDVIIKSFDGINGENHRIVFWFDN